MRLLDHGHRKADILLLLARVVAKMGNLEMAIGHLDEMPIKVAKNRGAVGIVQWMSVDLADRVAFSNHPDAQSDGGWPQVLHTFPQPIPVSAGEQLDVMVGHDRRSLIVTPAPGAPRQEEQLSGGDGRPVARGEPDREPERHEVRPSRRRAKEGCAMVAHADNRPLERPKMP